MKITSIDIRNHSRISDCTIDVRDNLILVGANGSGKSSIIRCVDLALGKTTQQLYYSINSSDFEDEEQPFIVEVKLGGLSKDELSFFPDDYDVIDNSLTVRMEATLDKDDLTIRRYSPKGARGDNLRREQLASIGWSMIPSDFSTTQLESGRKTIVDDYLKEVDASGDQAKLADAIKSLSDAIDGSGAFNDALSSLANQLDPVLDGGITASKLHFVPEAAINGDLLNNVRLQIEGRSGTAREATEQSDGTKALIAFSIFNLLNSGGMIAIDEPETHLHPSAQRNLIRILKSTGRQLVIATHSGVVAGEFEPDNIAVTREGLPPVQPRRGFLAGQEDQKTLARWWISSRIELLTAKQVIAVEGQSDRIMLEEVAENMGCHLERDGIEILEAGGCREMPHVLEIFGKSGFGLRVSILVDEDAEKDMADALGVEAGDLTSKSVYVSRSDLEAEYVAAIGADRLWETLGKSSLFTPNMLKNCAISDDSGKPDEDELAEFCRRKKNKIFCAVVACKLLDEDSAQRVSSVIEVLQNAV
jgi:hypothetical protein